MSEGRSVGWYRVGEDSVSHWNGSGWSVTLAASRINTASAFVLRFSEPAGPIGERFYPPEPKPAFAPVAAVGSSSGDSGSGQTRPEGWYYVGPGVVSHWNRRGWTGPFDSVSLAKEGLPNLNGTYHFPGDLFVALAPFQPPTAHADTEPTRAAGWYRMKNAGARHWCPERQRWSRLMPPNSPQAELDRVRNSGHKVRDADVVPSVPLEPLKAEATNVRPDGWYHVEVDRVSHWSNARQGWTYAMPRENAYGSLDRYLLTAPRLVATRYAAGRRFYPSLSPQSNPPRPDGWYHVAPQGLRHWRGQARAWSDPSPLGESELDRAQMAAATHLTPDADVACGPPCGGPSELREARPEGWYEIGAGMASHWSFVHDGWTIAFPKEHIQGDLDDFLRKVIRLPASYYTSTRRFYPKVSA